MIKKRDVTNTGPQPTSMIKKRDVTNTGPNRPFRCLDDFMHYPLMVFDSTWALKHMAGVALIDPNQADSTKESKLALVPSRPLPIKLILL